MARAYLEDISEGRFTEATIRRMFELVDRAKTDEKFQKLVYGVVNRSMPGQWKQYGREVQTLMDWLRRSIDYRRDPANVELVQDVWATLDRKRADCDDFVVIFCAAAETLGAPCRMVTVSTRQNREPSHVYAEVYVDGGWTPADLIVPWAPLGWEPTEGVTARKVWTRKAVGLSGDDEEDAMIEGLGHRDIVSSWKPWQYNVRGRRRRDDHGRWEGGFADKMFDANLSPYPDDVAATFAPGIPGTQIISPRITEGRLVASLADQKELPGPGGVPYAVPLPMMSHESPSELWTTIPGKDVPEVFDPTLWTGQVPENISMVDYTLPQPYSGVESELTDLSGLDEEDELDGITMLGKFGKRVRGLHRRKIKFAKGLRKRKIRTLKKGLRLAKRKRRNKKRIAWANYRIHRDRDKLKGDLEAVESEWEKEKEANLAARRDARDEAKKEIDEARAEAHEEGTPGEVDGIGYYDLGDSPVLDEDLDDSDAVNPDLGLHEERHPGDDQDFDTDTMMGAYMTERQLEPESWGVAGLFDDVKNLASSVVSGVTGGLITTQQVGTAVDVAVNWYQQKRGIVPSPTTVATQTNLRAPTPTPPPTTVAQKAAFGLGTLVPIGIGVFVLMHVFGGKKRRTRRKNPVLPVSWNPGRRRRRR